jgi:pilus assembly protein TadC
MRKSLQLALTILVLMLAVAGLSHFLDWMNLPSDSFFWGGVLGALLLLVAVPSILAAIWRGERPRQN